MKLKVLRKSGGGYYLELFKISTDIVLMSYVPYRYNVAKDTGIINMLI